MSSASQYFQPCANMFIYCTHLRASLSETEDVVNEKQHILSLFITEVLCYSQTSQGNTSTSAWGLVHLTVHQGHLIRKTQLTYIRHNLGYDGD